VRLALFCALLVACGDDGNTMRDGGDGGGSDGDSMIDADPNVRGTVTVKIVDKNGSALQGFYVVFIDTDATVTERMTDAAGVVSADVYPNASVTAIRTRGMSYALVTVHRAGNVDVPERLERVVEILERLPLPAVFPVHPRTRKRLADAGLMERVDAAVRVTLPIGYLDFLKLARHARAVLTDSGGIQEETTALGIPCLTLRENTERPITVEMGTNVIVGTDTTKIVAAANAALNGSAKKALRQPPLWDGQTSERILDALESL